MEPVLTCHAVLSRGYNSSSKHSMEPVLTCHAVLHWTTIMTMLQTVPIFYPLKKTFSFLESVSSYIPHQRNILSLSYSWTPLSLPGNLSFASSDLIFHFAVYNYQRCTISPEMSVYQSETSVSFQSHRSCCRKT